MSTDVKLTKPQQDLLDAIRAGVTVSFSPYMRRFNPGEYYIRLDTSAKCTPAARALLNKGLVEKVGVSWLGHNLGIKS
jgi:hypothetical protein